MHWIPLTFHLWKRVEANKACDKVTKPKSMPKSTTTTLWSHSGQSAGLTSAKPKLVSRPYIETELKLCDLIRLDQIARSRGRNICQMSESGDGFSCQIPAPSPHPPPTGFTLIGALLQRKSSCPFLSWGKLSWVEPAFKAVFHFKRIVAKRSVFFCVHVISFVWAVTKQWNTVRFATIRLKWKTGFSWVLLRL